jgi:hypothetical protein
MSDWKIEAEKLRTEGLTIREIAARVGKSRGVVGEHFKPHYCECGNRRMHHRTRCRDCWRALEAASRQRRLGRIAGMYNAGLPLREIAKALGRPVEGVSKMRAAQMVGADIAEARRAGLLDDYRVPEGDKRRSAA